MLYVLIQLIFFNYLQTISELDMGTDHSLVYVWYVE